MSHVSQVKPPVCSMATSIRSSSCGGHGCAWAEVESAVEVTLPIGKGGTIATVFFHEKEKLERTPGCQVLTDGAVADWTISEVTKAFACHKES